LPASIALDLPKPSDVEIVQRAVVVAGANTLLDYDQEQQLSDDYKNTPLECIGVRRGDGTIPPNGRDVYRHRWPSPLELSQLQGEIGHIAGRAFYGGIVGPHFGHLLTQSMGRLWAAVPDIPIIFLPANLGFVEIPDYFGVLLRLLGVENPIQLVAQTCTVDELIVARDLCNLDHRRPIEPLFAQWLAQRRPKVAVQEDVNIYVSRASLGPNLGQYLQEVALENALREQGYRIVYPEKMQIQDQIDIYLRAKNLIFADGSAIHLWSLFASAEQSAALICRRAPPRSMVAWFQGLPQANVQFFDSRLAEFNGKPRGANRAVALLDMDQIWRRLRRRGFHSTRHAYFPPRARVTDWLAAVQGGADLIASAPFEMDATTRTLLETRPNFRAVRWENAPPSPTNHNPPPHPP
jgi:Glycosyltransferase 61